jgi:hypothetical protein
MFLHSLSQARWKTKSLYRLPTLRLFKASSFLPDPHLFQLGVIDYLFPLLVPLWAR